MCTTHIFHPSPTAWHLPTAAQLSVSCTWPACRLPISEVNPQKMTGEAGLVPPPGQARCHPEAACTVLLRSKHPEHMHTRDTCFSIHSSPGITFSRLAQPCLKQTGATVHRVKQGWNKGECIEHSKLFVLLYVNTLTAVMVLFEKSGLCKVQRYL